MVSAVVFCTSLLMLVATSERASPSAVVPLATSSGSLKLSRSVRGTAWRAEESKVMTET
ncbi:hypothetical protein D3C77_803820 [compost metagenome]